MNIVLIRPPAGYSTGRKPNIMRGLYLLPQGIIYLGEALLRRGHDVRIIDVEAEGLLLNDIIEKLKIISLDVVGITTSTPSWPFIKLMANTIRKFFPEIPITMGGGHAIYEYEKIIEEKIADIVFIGESENSFPQYIDVWEKNEPLDKIFGIAFLQNNQVVKTKPAKLINIDTWGIPAYQLLDMEKYKKCAGVCVSGMRGCPGQNCAFCLVPRIHSHDPLSLDSDALIEYKRMKSAESLFREVVFLHDKFGVKNISFIDPTFTLSSKRVIKFCKLLKQNNIRISWCCQTRSDCVEDNLLEKMAEAGCVSILFGVESSDDAVLNYIHKQSTKNLATQAIEKCFKHGINVTPSLIMGLPGDSEAGVQKHIDYVKYLNDQFGLNNYLQFNTFMPSPGSSISLDSSKYEVKVDDSISHSFWILVPITSTPGLSLSKHRKYWHDVWKTFFQKYYHTYLEVERCALNGYDPLLECFGRGYL